MKKIFYIAAFILFISPTIYAKNANATLIIQPGAGAQPVIKAIDSARQHIRLTIYTFNDKPIIRALIKKEQQGVNVQVILEKSPYTRKRFNRHTYSLLKRHHIAVRSGNSRFAFTHQKTLIIDRDKAFIMTGNLTPSGIYYQRNFYYATQNQQIIQSLINLFKSDWYRIPFYLKNTNLVLSPNNSKQTILNLIRDTQHQLLIYAAGIDDYKITESLEKKARHGVNIMICSSPSILHSDKKFLILLQQAGVNLFIDNNLTIHAKVLISDSKTAYLGSANLTFVSLTKNRETGILAHNLNIIRTLTNTFFHDIKQSQKNQTF